MGCDIHPYIERKINGEWHMIHRIYADYGKGDFDGHGWGAMRDYQFFAHLCGVRGGYRDTGEAWPEPKGLPDDVSVVVKWESDQWDMDGHSHSWETVNGYVDKKLALQQIRNKASNSREYDEYKVLGYEIHEEEGRDEYRVVFWFDN